MEEQLNKNNEFLIKEIENLKTLNILSKVVSSGGNFIPKELANDMLKEMSHLIKEVLKQLSISNFDVYNQRDVCKKLREEINILKKINKEKVK